MDADLPCQEESHHVCDNVGSQAMPSYFQSYFGQYQTLQDIDLNDIVTDTTALNLSVMICRAIKFVSHTIPHYIIRARVV